MIPKFRAWDKNNKEMISWRYLLNGHNLRNVFMRTEMCGLELMQSTGLKDKNGVEIYKGSIVKPERNSPFVVTDFIEGKGIIQSVSISVGSYSLVGFYSGEELEVIGDIYTKPELLEDEK